MAEHRRDRDQPTSEGPGFGALLPPSIDELGRSAPDEETATYQPPPRTADQPGLHVRLFGSHQFFRLWLAQMVASLGDWVGFLAISVLAAGISKGSGAAAIGLVMTARILPGFFLAPVAGVLIDRWDRKQVMVLTNLGRAAVVAMLPFVGQVSLLILASLLLEVCTLLWSPAKESSVPDLVPHDHLTTANSLSLAAAYGTFPFASLLFALLATVSEWLVGLEDNEILKTDQVSLAFAFQAVCFVFSAMMISTLELPRQVKRERSGDRRADWSASIRQLKEGWRYVFINPTVKAVNLGLATGLIGGGMLVPLGSVFSDQVLGEGASGYGFFITSLGVGVAAGVLAISLLQKRLPKATVFASALFGAGATLFVAACTSTLWLAAFFVFVMGMCAGSVYVLGFTLLHEEVDEELRARVFAALYTMVRLCVLLAFALAPFLTAILGSISEALFEEELTVGSWSLYIPGVRLTLWLAALIIMGASVIAMRSIRSGARADARAGTGHPTLRPRALGPGPAALEAGDGASSEGGGS